MWVSEYRQFWGKISPVLKQNIAVFEADIEYRILKSPISRIADKVFQGPYNTSPAEGCWRLPIAEVATFLKRPLPVRSATAKIDTITAMNSQLSLVVPAGIS